MINVRTKVKLQSYVVMGYVKNTVDIGWVGEINPAHLVQENKSYVIDVVKRYKGLSFNGLGRFSDKEKTKVQLFPGPPHSRINLWHMERMLNAKGTLERNTGNLASIEVERSRGV